MRIVIYTLFVLSLLSLFASIARGQEALCSSGAYYVSGVEVSAEGSSGIEARQRAEAAGLSEAWERLIERLLGEGSASVLSDAVSVESFVEYTRVEDEIVLPSRYSGRYDYCFAGFRLRSFFAERELRYTELFSQPILVLPAVETGNDSFIFRKSPWQSAWQEALANYDGLLRFHLVERLATERELNASQIISGDRLSLARAAEIESAEKVMVTIMAQNENNNANFQGRLYANDGRLESLFYKTDEVANEALSASVAKVIGALEERWHDENATKSDSGGIVRLTLYTSSMEARRGYLEILENLPSVQELEVTYLSFNKGEVLVKLSSSARSFVRALEGMGLGLSEEKREDGEDGEINYVLVSKQ